jgi:hypothetical protein
MKNFNDTIEIRSRDLPVCSAVPQPLRHRVPPPRHPISDFVIQFFLQTKFCTLKNIVFLLHKLHFLVILYRVELVGFVNISTQVSLIT